MAWQALQQDFLQGFRSLLPWLKPEHALEGIGNRLVTLRGQLRKPELLTNKMLRKHVEESLSQLRERTGEVIVAYDRVNFRNRHRVMLVNLYELQAQLRRSEGSNDPIAYLMEPHIYRTADEIITAILGDEQNGNGRKEKR